MDWGWGRGERGNCNGDLKYINTFFKKYKIFLKISKDLSNKQADHIKMNKMSILRICHIYDFVLSSELYHSSKVTYPN